MSDLNLELNVLQYSKEELEDLLNLKKNYKFSDIHNQALKVKDTIFNIESIDQDRKKQISFFLKDAMLYLQNHYIVYFFQKKLV
uniref:Uncharacterized protein n=1 Tax=viral metagenome TaxID=1070528 RepID=A0A6C0KCU4_9ZZZZ|tara:strand:- start:307 stop:558 length:252 start_codon:yes stop_codon:yes gene_type:complete